MSVFEIPVADEPGVRRFVGLEPAVWSSHPLYVPASDEEQRFRITGRSLLHREVEATLFLATEGERDVARCAAFVNHAYQRYHGERTGFIGYIAAADDAGGVVVEMLDRAERHLAGRGCTRVIAPFNATDLAGTGVRTAAFDESPIFPFSYAPPSVASWLDAAGYRRRYPWWSYRVDLTSEVYRQTSRRSLDAPACRVRCVDKRRWDDEVRLFGELFNGGFAGEWEFQPYTTDQFHEVLDPLRTVLDPAEMLFAEVDGEPVGLCLGAPDWNPLTRRLHGKRGALAAWRFALGARRYRYAALLMIALVPGSRGRGVGRTLAATLYRHYERRGLGAAEYCLVNDENTASRMLAESFGGRGRILYHTFDKPLADEAAGDERSGRE